MLGKPRRNAIATAAAATRAAKIIECVNPRVAPKVTVMDAELESDDIKIRNNRTKCANRPNALWNARGVEAGSNTKRNYCMRKY